MFSMNENRFTIIGTEYVSYYGGDAQIVSNGTFEFRVWEREEDAQKVCDLLNELNGEIRLLKCALALNAVTNISLNDKKIDIPPYYEFENYKRLQTERREDYDEYW